MQANGVPSYEHRNHRVYAAATEGRFGGRTVSLKEPAEAPSCFSCWNRVSSDIANTADAYGFVEDLSDETVSLLERRMRPNISSAAGFLGPDESLRAVCLEDRESLKAMGISYEEIAELLEELVSTPLGDRLQNKVSPSLGGRFKVYSEPSFGYQYCPFFVDDVEGCGRGNANHIVTRIADGATLFFSDLHAHLIRDHHFFEGKETEYRLDPSDMADFFGMEITAEESRT